MNDIVGYRNLAKDEILLINDVKRVALDVEGLIERIRENGTPDPRWLSIGVTDLQKGFMAVTRSIAKPSGF